MKPLVERFNAHVDRSAGPDACWPWHGSSGYGGISDDGKHVYAHRLAYELANGPVPKGLQVLHGCDNPACCNPAHLRAGTQKENVRDAVARGRFCNNGKRGPEHHDAKLYYRAQEIRDRYAKGETITSIARSVGAARSSVGDVAKGLRHQARP